MSITADKHRAVKAAIEALVKERDAATNAALERAAVVCATEWATAEERKHGRALAAEIRALKEEA